MSKDNQRQNVLSALHSAETLSKIYPVYLALYQVPTWHYVSIDWMQSYLVQQAVLYGTLEQG